MQITWARKGGYECSSKGDKRFSAFNAMMPDGRSIEQWYQCDVKGFQFGGTDWKKGKGQPSKIHYPGDDQYQMYKSLWRFWAIYNFSLMVELLNHARQHNNTLSDMFASTPMNQAKALSEILNEWFIDE